MPHQTKATRRVSSYLFEFFDRPLTCLVCYTGKGLETVPLVNTTALIDQVTFVLFSSVSRSKRVYGTTSGCGFAGVDVADDNDVDMDLFLPMSMSTSA